MTLINELDHVCVLADKFGITVSVGTFKAQLKPDNITYAMAVDAGDQTPGVTTEERGGVMPSRYASNLPSLALAILLLINLATAAWMLWR